MSVSELDVVDVISTDKNTGHVILTVSDHLDWSDSIQHQTALQGKLNKYLAFIESGEILQRYPDAKDRPVVIKVVFKYTPDRQGYQFLGRAQEIIKSAGFIVETSEQEFWNRFRRIAALKTIVEPSPAFVETTPTKFGKNGLRRYLCSLLLFRHLAAGASRNSR